MANDSDILQRFLSRRDTREALQWLAEADRAGARLLGLLGATEASREYVQSLYNKGAKEVLVSQVDSYPWGEQSGTLIVVLPSDGTSRDPIFEEEHRWALQGGFEPVADSGQQFVLLKLD